MSFFSTVSARQEGEKERSWVTEVVAYSRQIMRKCFYGFLSSFLKIREMSSIISVVDQFSKYAIFVPTSNILLDNQNISYQHC